MYNQVHIKYHPKKFLECFTYLKCSSYFGLFNFDPIEVQVLECSALAPDLALLPAGDRTQIGEQGGSICKYLHF